MQPKVLIINIALAFLLVFMAINVVEVWRKTPSYPEAAAVESATGNDIPAAFNRRMPDEKNYDTIVSNNLFSEDRMLYLPSESEEIVFEKKIQGKNIVLYGVVQSGDHVTALISNPNWNLEKGSKKSIWVNQGDKIANLKVVDIGKDSILLNDGETKYKLLLYDDKERANDSSKQNSRESAAASESPTVVTTSQPQKAAAEPQKNAEDSGSKENLRLSTPFGSIIRRR